MLEQIIGYTYEANNAGFNQISIIQNDFKLYFWRRRKNEETEKFEMQLWRYDHEKKNKCDQGLS